MKYIGINVLLLLFAIVMQAQEVVTVTGTVYRADTKKPLESVQVSSPEAAKSVITDEEGNFKLKVKSLQTKIQVTASGYFTQEVLLAGRNELRIYILPETDFMTTDSWQTLEGNRKMNEKVGTAVSINKKDIGSAYASPDDALVGRIAGLRVLNKSGMPGEGSFVNVRGLRSMVAENTPLIVVDGMPYLPDQQASVVVSGFSRNMFMPTNMKDIESVTVLKGADAAVFGSLGSNGVIMISTEKATDLETKVQVQTVDGVSFMRKRIPLLEADEFKNYIGDIGETRYSDLNQLAEKFPFLTDDPQNHYAYLYDNNTDWQEEIYTPAFTTENILKIKGGDAIANYALSVGFMNNKGVVENTKQSKYYTRLNSDINVTRKFKVFATAGFNYSDNDLAEQGINRETNPVLASLYQSPLLSVYEQDRFRNNLPNFNPVHGEFRISNPKALVSDVQATSKSYDILVNVGFNYDLYAGLKLSAIGGLYYNYTKEDLFVPGKSSHAIAPLMNGLAENTVRSGTGEGLNYYVRGNLTYNNTFRNVHEVSGMLGYQMSMSRREFDCGSGINTTSDFYNSLNNIDKSMGRRVVGNINKWNWMNAFLTAKYGFRQQYYVSAVVTLDAASSYGTGSNRIFAFPSGQLAWNMKNASFLRDVDAVSMLTLRGEYGMNGNSRYSSKYGRWYYESIPFRDVAGMTNAAIPNNSLKPEKNLSANIGVDFALVGNRFKMGVDFYQERTKDMLLAKEMASTYGKAYMYDNAGEIKSQGIEANLSVNMFNRGSFRWTVGGNIAAYRSEIVRLGGAQEQYTYFTDGARLVSKVGEAPNLFYGYRAEKVFASRQEADATGYVSHTGVKFAGGDVKFTDRDNNKVINDDDMMVLGNPTPDFYGGFFSHMSWKGFGLFLNFSYSYGNDVYNAVRRTAESMTDFSNQSRSVEKRWVRNGDLTDVPRAVYGDQIGNSRFSSRWIEDGSYLKLKEVTLSYETDKKVLFFNKLKAYVTGENLFTVTNYLGLDPEFSYSYDPTMLGMDLGKVPVPKSVKVGLILNF